MRHIEVKSEWAIREDGWIKISGFSGYLQTPKGTIPVRGEFEEFLFSSSLVDAGDRIVRHIEFRQSTGGKLLRAEYILRTCGYSLSSWDESPAGQLMEELGVSRYL